MDCEVVRLRYYKVVDTSGKLISIGTGSDGIEITAEEYEELSSEIKKKAELVSDLSAEKISEGEIREDWREEIVWRASEISVVQDLYTEDELSAMTNEELETILASYNVSASMNKSNLIRLILSLQEGPVV